MYRVGLKSMLLILSEYVNKTQKIGRMWTNTNSYKENEALSDHFSREIVYIKIVLCLSILWLKAVNEITARQTWTSLRKHDVIEVCDI